jgi:fermentation-respiration switch protein FrsA (DUF1100 family)
VIADPGFPIDNSAWWDELVALRPLKAVGALGTRPLLVIHGSDDRSVPASWAQTLARAARGPVDLRVVPGGGHWLRADPRVVATLIGWTERQRHRSG